MIKIQPAGLEQISVVFDLVERLLQELNDGENEFTGIDRPRIKQDWAKDPDQLCAFIAADENDQAVGVITLVESYAIYAGGNFGIINELYVSPKFRSQKVGKELLEAVKEYARKKGWKRIDVTAPPGQKWERAVRFYEREGFIFTGPKLRFTIP
jgi:GNAT superfamily N-acetyltransferase